MKAPSRQSSLTFFIGTIATIALNPFIVTEKVRESENSHLTTCAAHSVRTSAIIQIKRNDSVGIAVVGKGCLVVGRITLMVSIVTIHIPDPRREYNNITSGLSNAALIMLENKHPFSRILLLI
ncbi:hypothetical protein PNOK_0319100 [Pyrrhoderma noxium]|uniref:Uncharacterized protein n=1 Tax=Pyrrhoderma noxium TaxID=2282107 RepID=A0A286UM45_9AGAM|nr:hypothetical protein PNOK_0319100 [Pyrrhoderma noxium]